MKILIAILLLVGGTMACESKNSTQNIRDNETPVTAKDVTKTTKRSAIPLPTYQTARKFGN